MRLPLAVAAFLSLAPAAQAGVAEAGELSP